MKSDNWQPVRRIESDYQRALDFLYNRIYREIKGHTDPYAIIAKIKILTFEGLFTDYIEKAITRMVTATKADGAKNWREAAAKGTRGREIYEALRQEMRGPIGAAVKRQVQRNAEIIKTLPLDISRKVTEYIEKEAINGRRASDIAADILEKFPKDSRASAQLIARTEVSKTSTALTRARAEALNLPWYIWRTAKDSRVRSSHDHMEGVLVRWSDPPAPEVLDGGKSEGNYHAGNIYNCRCYPEPLITLALVKWPAKVYYGGKIQSMTRAEFEQIAA